MHPRLWTPIALLALTACPREHEYPFCSLIDEPSAPEVVIDEAGVSFVWEGAVHGIDLNQLPRHRYIWGDWCEDGAAPCLTGPRQLPANRVAELVSGESYEVSTYVSCTAGGNDVAERAMRERFTMP